MEARTQGSQGLAGGFTDMDEWILKVPTESQNKLFRLPVGACIIHFFKLQVIDSVF